MSSQAHFNHQFQSAGQPQGTSAAPESLSFITGTRDKHEFARAQRHTNRVRLLKIALPVLAVVIIGVFAVAMFLRFATGPSIDLGDIKFDGGNLVMENPKLNGKDGKERPYKLSARRAIQNSSNPICNN